MPRLPVPTEHAEQAAFVRWFRLQYPGVLIFAIPNGAALRGTPGQRAAQMARLKAEGFVPGIPDLHVPAWGLWVEMKRAKGGRVSKEQAAIHGDLQDNAHFVIVAAGFADATAQTRAFWQWATA